MMGCIEKFPTVFYQQCREMIHKCHAALDVHVNGAADVATGIPIKFHVQLNTAQQAATRWSDTDLRNAIVCLEYAIHNVTPEQNKHSNTLFQHHYRQLLHKVWNKATSLRIIFATNLAQMTALAEYEIYWVANVTGNQHGDY